jgi:hypothetical protein
MSTSVFARELKADVSMVLPHPGRTRKERLRDSAKVLNKDGK